MEELALYLENGCFSYNEEYYKQVYGVTMSGCLPVNVVGIVMNFVSDKVLVDTNVKLVLLVKYTEEIWQLLRKTRLT